MLDLSDLEEEVTELPPSYSTLQLYPDNADDDLPSFAEVLNHTRALNYRMRRASSVEEKEDCKMKRAKFESQMKMFRSLDF